MAGAGYDIGASTSIQQSPQSGVGGGNVFNMAPLFGNIFGGQAASSYGNNPVTPTAVNTAAAKSPDSPTTVVPPSVAGNVIPQGVAAVTSTLSSYLPLLLIGGAILAAVAIGFKLLKK